MDHPTAYHQLGRFIVMFQNLETAINELTYLITDVADDPKIADLKFTKRLDATDKLGGFKNQAQHWVNEQCRLKIGVV